MPRFDSGWLRLERKAALGDIGENFTTLGIWTWLLATARLEDGPVRWKGERRELKKGQVLMSVRAEAKKRDLGTNTLLRHLRYLEARGSITVEKGTHGTIVTILNWQQYQDSFKDDGTPVEHLRNTNETPTEHGWNTNGTRVEHQRNTYGTRLNKETKKQRNNGNKETISFPEGSSPPVLSEVALTPVLVEATVPSRPPTPPGPHTKTGPTWSAYASAFKARYQQDAVVNKRNLVLCSQLVDRLGKDAAPEVAAFFVSHNDGFYVKALHPLTLCLRDCEKLHTEWKLGRQMTGTLARQVEETQTNRSAIDDYLRSKGASA